MKKYLISFLILLALGLISPVVFLKVNASYGQYGQPSPSYSIMVDKMVGMPGISNDPKSYKYVDNLAVSDPRFNPDQIVFFKVRIKNNSSAKLRGMEVRDVVPLYLEPLEGPGSYNSQTREIVWNAGDFEVGQEKIFYLKMKVTAQNNLPADKGLLCVTNFVKANSANAYDDDTAQLCIEKQVKSSVTKTPDAGAGLGILILAGNLLGAGIGVYLRKTNIKQLK